MLARLLVSSLEQGLVYAAMAMGVFLTYRVLRFADLTVDGSFPLGAAVAARLMVMGVSPLAATAAALPCGFAAGAVTGVIHTRLKLTGLLSGILTMTALYSVNLRIMGAPNIPLLTGPNMMSLAEKAGIPPAWAPAVVFGLVVVLIVGFTTWLSNTQYGLALRATGENRLAAESHGVNADSATVVTLGISNALAALSGALTAQYLGFADASMGVGTVIAGLAAVIMGAGFFRGPGIALGLAGTVAGSLAYRLAVGTALRLGLPPTDLKLISAIIVMASLGFPTLTGKIRHRSANILGREGRCNPKNA